MNLEEHKRKYFQAFRPVVEELRKKGFEINKADFTHLQAKNGIVLPLEGIGIEQEADDLQYLKKKYNPLPPEVVELLVSWIPRIKYAPVQEVLIGQLSGTKVKYNGNVLLNVFKNTDDKFVRDRIGFVLSETNPEIDLVELENLLLDPNYGDTKSSLILAGARHLAPEKINDIAMKELDSVSGFALRALRKTGGPKELELLRMKLEKGELDKKQKKEIEKTIDHIKKKLENE